ncbi:MAG: hypothetical protein AAFW84_07370 [Cyanobacteria bacterium J06635_15]
MTQPPKPSADLTRTLFSGGNFALSPTGPLRLAFWYNLLRHRPFWLLGALWFCCLLISMVAMGGLLDPGVEAEKAPPTVEIPTTVGPRAVTDPEGFITDAETPDGADATSETPLGTEIEPALEARLSPAVLLAFIGICSSGCWLLSRYLQAPRHLPKARMRQRKSRAVQPEANPTVSAAVAIQPPVKRLKPFDSAQVPSLYTDGKLPWKTAQAFSPRSSQSTDIPQVQNSPPPSPYPPISPSPSTPSGAASTPGNPGTETRAEASLVSEEATHALDWPEGSIAHQMDLRQRRSLSSLL